MWVFGEKMKKKFYKQIRKRLETGSALVMVLMMSTILLILLTTGLTLVMNSQKDTSEIFKIQGQAANVAQAGLQDAVNWFKRQGTVNQTDTSTPNTCKDAAFNPQYNADPTLRATDDAAVGLVKDLQIKGNIYGRYILRKQNCSNPEDPHAVRDITHSKGKSPSPVPTFLDTGTSTNKLRGMGVVWYLESEGILYERKNFAQTDGIFDLGPDQAPNRILRRATAGVEISQLSLNTDASPVTVYGAAGGHTFGTRLRLIGNTASGAAVHWTNNNPTVNAQIQLPGGTPNKEGISPTVLENDFIGRTFSVTASELRGMADNIYTSINQIPDRIPFSITYLDGNFTGANAFTNTQSLTGGGLLFVNGNLTLNDSANSIFSGVIFVNGTLTMGRDNSLAGKVIARRFVSNPGSGQSMVEHNSNIVTTVLQKLALYRENNLSHTVREY